MQAIAENLGFLGPGLPAERARLVRLCARLTGDAQAAEDLAQETLHEAWRNLGKLQDPVGSGQWLAAIARNVCLRWNRARGRELALRATQEPLDRADDPTTAGLDEWLADDYDLEVELERDELATLLDRALALLPPETRDILIARYIHESPQGELATHLGLSQDAVAKRLHRGRLALHRVLSTSLREEALTYALAPPDDGGWQPTRIWCPLCSQARLTAQINRTTGEAAFRCPSCAPGPDFGLAWTKDPQLLNGVKSYKSVFSRQIVALHAQFREALAQRRVLCPACSRPVRVRTYGPEDPPPSWVPAPLRALHGIWGVCDHCGLHAADTLQCYTLDMPATQRFWREQGRIRRLPEHVVEIDGRLAVASGFESVSGPDRLVVVVARDSFDVLALRAAPC
jgi:RNA polymerase sigma-70 factor (ECF subfamily)